MGIHERMIKSSREFNTAADNLGKAIDNFKKAMRENYGDKYIPPIVEWLSKRKFINWLVKVLN